jgi:GNAT superfamily N-acetyltransferase
MSSGERPESPVCASLRAEIGGAMHISRATLDDLADLSALFDAYRVFYEQPSAPDRAREFIAERFERGDAVQFIARDTSGAPLGFTQLYPCFSSVSMARIWILNDLYVASGVRKTGVGRALLRHARGYARETGALRLELSTAHTNTTAQALYESEGYVLDTTFRRYSLSC